MLGQSVNVTGQRHGSCFFEPEVEALILISGRKGKTNKKKHKGKESNVF